MEKKILDLESRITLKRFKPRPYQLPIFEAIEEKGFKKAIIVAPRRCLSGESHILLENGSFKLLKDISVGEKILSWDGNAFVEDIVKNIWKTEEKESVTVKANLQLPIITSLDHQFAFMETRDDRVRWAKIQYLCSVHKYLMCYAGSKLCKKHNPDLL